jgi:hypothetical protein
MISAARKTYYQIECVRRVSRITFIRYTQGRKDGKPNNKSLEQVNKGPNQLWSWGDNLSFMVEGG